MALSFASGLVQAYGGLNGYWGQLGNEALKSYCDNGPEYVTLSFVNQAPENTKSGYPGTNFAGHCWAGTYKNKDNIGGDLLSECYSIKEGIPYCQERGVKVLLSIGGVYNENGGNYKVSTDQKGVDFADFLWSAFGPYDKNWNGPRPFDADDGSTRPAIDGFDFDIEHDLPNGPYIAMINELRRLKSDVIITGAPQCPTRNEYFYMKEMIDKAKFDALFIQFYNNGYCDAIEDPDVSWDRFNYDEWVDIVDDSTASKGAKIYVGLPASEDAAGSGYIEPDALKELVCKLKDKPHFAGISLWDLTRGASNIIDGKTYNQHAVDALEYGCDPVPTTTTSAISSTTETSSTESTTTSNASTTTSEASTSETTTSDASTTATSTETTSSETSTSDASTEASSTTETATGTTTDVSSSATETSTDATDSSTATTETSTGTDASVTGTSSAATDSSATSDASTASTDSTEVNTATTSASEATDSTSLTSETESVPTTLSNTLTSTDDNTASTTDDTTLTTDTASESVPTSLPVTSSTFHGWNTTWTTGATQTQTYGNPGTRSSTLIPGQITTKGSTDGQASVTRSATISLTTSTVCTTRVYTVTKCPPEVVDCPAGGYVTTETIPLYTTVCPVTAKATPTQYAVAPEYETKTVYTTRVHTVTKCPPEVVNCPVGSVTTETIPVYTTVCPVTEKPQPVPTKVPGHSETKTLYTAKIYTPTECPAGADDCVVGKPTTEVASWTTAIVPPKETQPVHVYHPEVPEEEEVTTVKASYTVYTNVVVPPATLETTIKPAVTEKPSGVAAPTGGCSGPGCPQPTAVHTPTPKNPDYAPITPATAGASSLVAGLTAVVGAVLFQMFVL
ncbi:Chitinase 2 [Fusarium piperis]|uniref:chitinase n=1 Tax=Fusarium piperis TaxID=1435070 RepID=A0A9W9BQ63_9HYPO|nr:Chitinase 2 [Fusarium piperis]